MRALWHAMLAAAVYGASIGLVHSVKFALRNLVKFPLLIVTTASVCAICYYVVARWMASQLDARAVARATFTIFHDTSIVLVSLTPITFFMALTVRRPDSISLHEYPLFLAMNVLFITVSGALAVVRQCRQLVIAHGVTTQRGAWLIVAWLAASLFVGAQASWYMRPFCGVSSIDAPFMLGATPDFRGDTSFYQALWHLIEDPSEVPRSL